MARELDDWLVQGIESMVDGSYTPRHLKRHYFTDEMVDQLHLSDRIFQHILLKQLKPTFPYVMNSNCYHIHGPNGVRLATQRIRQVLLDQYPKYIIRADIKSFYKSIPHHQLVQDIKQHYHRGGADIATKHQTPDASHIVPHPRTLRKAREQIKAMVNSGGSPRRIRNYLHRWTMWWVRTSQRWQYQELLEWFLQVCWDLNPAAYAAGLLQHAIKKAYVLDPSAVSFHVTA